MFIFPHRYHIISDLVQNEGDYSLCTTPDRDDTAHSASPMFSTPFTSVAGGSKLRDDSVSKTPSRASTPGSKPRGNLKRTLQEALAEGSVKESQAIERLGSQKHERVLRELDLKRQKLENRALEQQHQREREREQHEFRMMQMQIIMSQNQQAVPGAMQAQTSLGSFGLMGNLDPALASGSPSATSFSM